MSVTKHSQWPRKPTCFPPPPSTLRGLNPTPAGAEDTEGRSRRATTAPAARGIPLHKHLRTFRNVTKTQTMHSNTCPLLCNVWRSEKPTTWPCLQRTRW
jgi:hypothetical protein